ncbi:hypothetical protein pb186bvf_003726 [Paramecium bursaria]
MISYEFQLFLLFRLSNIWSRQEGLKKKIIEISHIKKILNQNMILTMSKREKFITMQRKAQLKVILEAKRVFDARTYSDKLAEAILNRDQDEALLIQTQIYNNLHIEIVKVDYVELAYRQISLNFQKCYCVIFSLLTEMVDYQTRFKKNYFNELIEQSLEMLNLDLDYDTEQAYQIFINALLNVDKKYISKLCDSGLIQHFSKIQQKYSYDYKLLIHRVILDSILVICSKNQLYLYQAHLIEAIEKILEKALELQICEEELKGCLMYINSERINTLLEIWLENSNKYYVAFALEIFRVQEIRLTKQQIKYALSFNVRRLVEEVVKNLSADDMDVEINSILYDSFLDHSIDLNHQRLLSYAIDINYFDEIRKDEYIKYVFHSEDEEMIRNILPQFDEEDVLEYINLLDGLKNTNNYSDELLELAANLIHDHGFE